MDPTLPNAPVVEKLKTLNFSYAGRITNDDETIYKIKLSGEENSANGHIFLSAKKLALKEIKVEYFNNKELDLTQDNPRRNTRIASIIKIGMSTNGKQFLSYAEITNNFKALFPNDSIYDFQLKCKLAFNHLIEGKEVKKFRSNYNSKKAFNKTVAKFKQKQQWTTSEMLPMTNEELDILKDIYAD